MEQKEILKAINEDENLYLSQPIYQAFIRHKGGGYCSMWGLKEFDNLDKAKTTTFYNYVQSGASKGGYFKIEKIQYINGIKSLAIKELSEFIGSEKEFLLNNKMTVDEYEKELIDSNRFSYRVAPSFIEIEKKYSKK